MKSGTKKENKWFFNNGSFLPEEQIERIPNTWNNDNYVVVCDTKIVAYFEATWNKVLNVVVCFRLWCSLHCDDSFSFWENTKHCRN